MKAPSLGGRLGAALGISAGREGSPTDGHRRWRDGGQCLMGDAVMIMIWCDTAGKQERQS